jgi:hypothetical protein
MTYPPVPRRGAAAVWALVVLAVLTTVTAVAVKEFTATRRALDAREARAQAEWLARSGCELAVARLLADPTGYDGEVGSPVPGSEVRVTVTKAAEDTYRVECQAAYPAAGRGTVVRVVGRTVKRVGGTDAPRVEVVGP